jgi:hypothetical protein
MHIKNRFIPAEAFDIFDAEGNRLCRCCGVVLQSEHRASCNKCHQRELLLEYFDFSAIRWHYLMERRNREYIPAEQWGPDDWEMTCERCGRKFKEVRRQWDGFGVCANLHHVIPVQQLTDQQTLDDGKSLYWWLAFDPANLVLLCRECHGIAHRKEPKPPEPETRYVTLQEAISQYKQRTGERNEV